MGISAMASPAPARLRARARSGKSGFPAAFHEFSPVRRLEWLTGAEVAGLPLLAELVASGRLHHNQVEAAKKRIREEKLGVQRMAPTPACVRDWEGGQAFPPAADDPACRMRCAEHVVNEPTETPVMWPAYYVGLEDQTYERHLVAILIEHDPERDADRAREDRDRERGFYTSDSASAQAIQAAELNRVEVVSTLKTEFDLETEDEAHLLAVIEAHEAAALAARLTRDIAAAAAISV